MNNKLHIQKFPDKDLNFIIKNSYKDYLINNNIANLYDDMDFRISSQVLKYENGSRGVIFPSIKENRVDGLILSVLSRDEKNIDFFKLDISEKENKEIKELFNTQYNLFKNKLNKAIHFSTNKSDINGKIAGLPRCTDESGGGNGPGDDEDCRVIPGVIITVPPKVIPSFPGPDIVLPVTPGPFPDGVPEISADTWATQHIDESGIKDNKCANDVYQKLKNKSELFNNLLGKFKGNSLLNLKFEIKDLNVPANTNIENVKNGYVTVTFNPNYLGSSELGRANLFIHEMLHAYMTWQLKNAGWNGLDNANAYKSIDEKNLPDLLKAYRENNYNPGISEHEFISNFYIPKIVEALKAYNPNLGTDSEYEALAWNGLESTNTFKEMLKTNETRAKTISSIISDNIKNKKCGE